MGAVLQFVDGLKNAITGTGTSRDPRTRNTYTPTIPLAQEQIAAAFGGSGLMRKIVNIPALDMVREWRDWKLAADDLALVDAEETRLGLRQKVRQAEVLRGCGGGALILGLPGDPDKPAPKPAKGSLAFVHVVSRWALSFDRLEDDARLATFGEPVLWRLSTGSGQIPIDPSRVIPFRADTTLGLIDSGWSGADAFWGESTVQQVLEAVTDNDAARAAFSALLAKARVLRFGIPKLSELASMGDGETKIAKRLEVLALAESIHNAFIFDAGDPETGNGGEKITDAQYSFTGAKDMLDAYGEFVAAISDIPATRLLGRAPEGMNSSGQSQQEDWRKKVRALQTLNLAPCLDRLDRYLVPSAIGKTPDGAWYDFAPLDSPGEKELADIFKTKMDAVNVLAQTATVPEQALARGVQSMLVEDGYLPELEQALADIPEAERYGLAQAPDPAADPQTQGDPGAAQTGDPAPAGA